MTASDTPRPETAIRIAAKYFNKPPSKEEITELYSAISEMEPQIAALKREVEGLKEKLTAFGNYSPAAYEEVHKFYEEWPGGLDEVDACWKNWKHKAEAAERKADRAWAIINHLNDDPIRAQAYFWNHQGRNDRMVVIDAAIDAARKA